jgi:dienelactone hydrolase
MRRSPALLSLAALTLLVAAAPGARADESGTCPAARLDLSAVADPDLRRDLAAFDPPPGAPASFGWTARELRPASASEVRVLEVKFPSALPSPFPENNTVWCRYYVPRTAVGEPAPAALVLHHLGGDFALEAAIAEFLARSGVAAMEVEFPYYGPRRPKDGKDVPKGLLQPDAEAAVASVRQAVSDIRRAADWLAARPEVDRSRMGCVGISLGGILGALAAGVDPRFTRNALVIAGGDLPAILTHESRETKKARELMAERRITREQLAAMLRPIEPLRFAQRIKTSGLLMFNARRDEIIPREAADELWRAAGRPEIIWYESGHASVAVFILEICERTRDHFLAPAEDAPARSARF